MELTKRNLWTYTLGSIGRDTAGSLFSSFLVASFVIYTKDLTPAEFGLISLIVILARIFDACNDPIMGNILEVTRTKWGKFKPWIAIGMVLSAGVFIASFGNTAQHMSYVILFAVLYFIYSICFTMNDIAYWGMLPSLATKKADRDLLTSRAILFAGIGAGITQVIVPPFTTGSMAIGGTAVTAFPVLAVIFSAFFIGMQVITLVGVKEKPLPPKGTATVNNVGIGTIINTMKKNDQLLWIMVIFLMSTVANQLLGGGLGQMYIYFSFGYEGGLYTIFSVLGAVASGATLIFYQKLSKRFSRNQMVRIAIWGIVIGYAMMLLVGLALQGGDIQQTAGILKFVLLMFSNLFAAGGQNLYYLILMICIANTVEYNEWKTGTRAEGIIFSVRPLLTKFGIAIVTLITTGTYLITGVLQFTNGIGDTEREAASRLGDLQKFGSAEQIEAVTKWKSLEIGSILQQIPPQKSAMLLACITLVPIVLAVISYILYKRKFVLDEDRYEEIISQLEQRKKAVSAENIEIV